MNALLRAPMQTAVQKIFKAELNRLTFLSIFYGLVFALTARCGEESSRGDIKMAFEELGEPWVCSKGVKDRLVPEVVGGHRPVPGGCFK